MNQDDRIDELLNDLDKALSVEPSPAVAAKVRARIANEPARGWWSRAFVGQTFRSAGYAVVLVIAVAAAYLMWPRTTAAPEAPQLVSSREAAPAPAIVTPAVAPRAGKPTPRVAPPKPTQVTAPAREPEVLVSAATRLAIAQLSAAARDGRVTAESFSATPVSTELDLVTVTPIFIDVVKIEPPATNSGGGGTVR